MAVIKYRDSVSENKYEDDPHQDKEIGSAWRYEEVYNPKFQGKELTREEAIDLINERGSSRCIGLLSASSGTSRMNL